MSAPTLDIVAVRAAFPALASGYLYADNAGGSQCLATAAHAITDYLLNTNVQLGADYSVSVVSTQRVAAGAEAARELFNAESADEVAYGSSSTMLVENLARAVEGDVLEGEEIVITGEHESNAGPWKRLAARKGATIKLWNATQLAAYPNNTYAVGLQLDALLPLISAKTRVVAFTACSNILGSIIPVAEIVKAIRARGAELGVRKLEVCVDCVAYAPHRPVDVRAWDADYAYFSFYKVYGPHISVLYARRASLVSSLSSLGHHFLRVHDKPYKLQPGGPGYELPWGCTPVVPYLKSLTPSGTLEDAWLAVARQEQTLLKDLLGYLRSKYERGVRIVGDEREGETRVPTVSFVVAGERPIKSKDVVAFFDKKPNVGIRYGHFYAYTLVDTLQPKLDADDGIIRISLVHYNTVEEVKRIVEILEEVLV
ncbi:PLP-dependent transferase [Dichomitus squalens LYAD-421 SS1]|uniref:PLP-dependent transferase n=1 Tax=Dichomitus squalens (strain LYAD-421) TaxID=732165 RepID=R7SMD6_DICSQ|nr:PLP-dependent transferase [Dichomitus squalens LYAD-421 SS1]EJF57324.1 PLP-dependent transferase [Dichomitus squalens LYAD-421 SS1]